MNLGNPREFTMLELAQLVLALTDSSLPLRHLPLPEDDPRRRQPVIDLARELFGWSRHCADSGVGLHRRLLSRPTRRHPESVADRVRRRLSPPGQLDDYALQWAR